MQSGILNLARGNDQEIGITVNDSAGEPYNLSGCSIIFTARDSDYFSDIIILKTGTSHIAPESGITEITLVPSDTSHLGNKKYFFDVNLLDTGSKITTLMYGDMVLFPR